MKNKLINFLLTAVWAYLLSFVFGWYAVMIGAIVGALFVPLNKTAVFFVPFLAIFLSWALQSFMLSSANDFILAKRIAVLLPLNGNPYLLIVLTGIIGGLAAGFAAIFGSQLRRIFSN